MRYRRTINRKNARNGELVKFVISFVLVLSLSLFISANIASLIYKSSTYEKLEINFNNEDNKTIVKDSEKIGEEKMENYSKTLLSNNIVLFQGGVFNDLDNAEEFKKKIDNKTLSSIVNDGKYERVILGISYKDNFLDMVDFLKSNNIQFVKQVYKIPVNVEYNEEILKILEAFSDFILEEGKNILKDKVDITKLKEVTSTLDVDYGKRGSYELFNDLKESILDLEDSAEREELESIFNLIYLSFANYKS